MRNELAPRRREGREGMSSGGGRRRPDARLGREFDDYSNRDAIGKASETSSCTGTEWAEFRIGSAIPHLKEIPRQKPNQSEPETLGEASRIYPDSN